VDSKYIKLTSDNQNILRIRLNELASCETNKNEIQIDMDLDNTKSMREDWLSEIRLVCISNDKGEEDGFASEIRDSIVQEANLGANACIVSIEELQLS